ncbi:MAG: TonB-dependent receptor [Luteitalea sp.]|nr:TonB-dependent receptor [Luteitalea sp.]
MLRPRRTRSVGRSSFVSLGLFDLRRQNYLTTEPTTFLSRQTGEIQSRGLELESSISVADGLTFTGAYTWLRDFEIVRTSDPAELHKREPTVPEHTASFWGHYRFAQGRLQGFGIGGGIRYTGESFGDIANSAELTVPDYALFDAAVSYEIGAWQLSISGRNLADRATLTCWDSCYYGSRRAVNMTIGHHW